MKKYLVSFLIIFVFVLNANANNTINWSVNPNNKNLKPSVAPEAAGFLDKYDVFYMDDTENKVLYVTFDAGFDNGYHTKILDTLKEKGVHATFFVDGNFLRRNAELVKRIIAEGNIVANHSLRHPDTTKISSIEDYEKQLLGWEDLFIEVTGQKSKMLYRPPMGKFSEQTLKWDKELGFKTIFWSFAYKDWEVNNQPSRDYAFNKIYKRVHPGCVMLLHSTSKTNSEILGEMIDNLKAKGYTFGDILDLTKQKEYNKKQ